MVNTTEKGQSIFMANSNIKAFSRKDKNMDKVNYFVLVKVLFCILVSLLMGNFMVMVICTRMVN